MSTLNHHKGTQTVYTNFVLGLGARLASMKGCMIKHITRRNRRGLPVILAA